MNEWHVTVDLYLVPTPKLYAWKFW